MRLGLIGGGVVGRATARAFVEFVDEVRVYDVDPTRRTHILGDTLQCDVIFICLPTPQKEGSLECDTSAVEAFFREAAGKWLPSGTDCYRNQNYVLRSTVPIGFTRQMRVKYGLVNLCHSPEFLTARCSLIDAQMPSRNIIGYPATPPQPYLTSLCKGAAVEGHPLEALYRKRWPHVPLEVLASDESEAVKLYTNTFFSVKVGAFNELQHDATKRGLNWERIHKVMLMDGRISPSHTLVPGGHGFGYAGTCLPKDIANFIDGSIKAGCEPMVALAAHTRNVTIDRKRTV